MKWWHEASAISTSTARQPPETLLEATPLPQSSSRLAQEALPYEFLFFLFRDQRELVRRGPKHSYQNDVCIYKYIEVPIPIKSTNERGEIIAVGAEGRCVICTCFFRPNLIICFVFQTFDRVGFTVVAAARSTKQGGPRPPERPLPNPLRPKRRFDGAARRGE